MTREERARLKEGLELYLDDVIADEEYYNTYEKCQKEVKRVEGRLTANNADEWLRGLPIGVEYNTWNICVRVFTILGWKYDPLFSLGRVRVQKGNFKFGVDSSYIDSLYWQILGEIIAEHKSDWQRYISYLHEWADIHKDDKCGGQSPVCFDEWCDNEKYFEEEEDD